MSMRLLPMSPTFSEITSAARKPAGVGHFRFIFAIGGRSQPTTESRVRLDPE